MESPQIIPVVCALIEKGDQILLAQRPPHKHLGGKWEFPGGKVEPDETSTEALHRELLEELGCTVKILQLLTDHTHYYPTVSVKLIPFVVQLHPADQPLQTHEHSDLKWVHREQLLQEDLPEADRPIIEEYLKTKALH